MDAKARGNRQRLEKALKEKWKRQCSTLKFLTPIFIPRLLSVKVPEWFTRRHLDIVLKLLKF